MNRKATAIAPSNIAFIKYWGTQDTEQVLPFNPSISMTLRDCVSRCTVELLPAGEGSEVLLRTASGELEVAPPSFAAGVDRHAEALIGGLGGGYRIGTQNSFPTGAGLASSASGFAALTLAILTAAGDDTDAETLSILARRSGSGSAARSVLGGYVQWPPDEDAAGPALSLVSADHWELCDVVAVVDSRPKEVSSREGHRRAPTSPHFGSRMAELPTRLEAVRAAIQTKSLAELGPVIEEEAIELHLIAMSSRPPIYYWKPGTLEVLAEARRLRGTGVGVWATIDAGPNVHLICEPGDEEAVAGAMEELDAVEQVIRDRVGPGPRTTEEHLF